MPSTLARLAATVTAGALALTLAACGSDDGTADKPGAAAEVNAGKSASPYQGTPLDEGFDKPDVTLTDTRGKPFNLRTRTKGRVTLLYFGYTHCPDVCPTTMSDIALAKQKLPEADEKKIDVVMITTDPGRDTPESLRSWLNAMDPSFIGLTGEYADIRDAGRTVGVHVPKARKGEDGEIIVDHGAQVLAFSAKDDRAHVLYTAGSGIEAFEHDLPLLLKGVPA
ncbi:hypothetical protein AQ490_26460 [Wenjunlia vitaminophila]|uniref:Thioredoxin domain-containing protein n=1 Tax=Wenjunlia vitaminophila TaxID=76728 RepID=A0A0T6LPU6_WENVI|nr:SCO family protein [Wenjunlia vitaminophila]KRV48086.1 hypothetical protein AQ490_26460 [Wenjunlia vitaminophila]